MPALCGDKISVRQHLKLPGQEVPPNNLLQVYFDACQKHGVTAQTGVSAQLLSRVRIVQPLPYHRVVGLDRQQLIQALAAHLDPAGSGKILMAAAEHATAMLNPRYSWPDMMRAGVSALQYDAVQLRKYSDAIDKYGKLEVLEYKRQFPSMPKEAFEAIATAAASSLSDAELQQGVLETLAFPSRGVDGSDQPTLVAVLFDYLDVEGQGHIIVDDFRVVVSWLSSGMGSLNEDVPILAKKGFEKVLRAEFLQALLDIVIPKSGLSPAKVERAVYALWNSNIRSQFKYNFSRDYLGAAGLDAVVEALRHDPTFVGLNLSGCGLTDSCCSLLLDLLKDHPSITSLDLSHNPIGDRGGVILTQLLESNRRLTQLNIEGIQLLRQHSRTHHDNLGPSACEDAAAIYAALLQNQAQQQRSGSELVLLLRQHALELKEVFVKAADKQSGRVALPKLQAELYDMAANWGFGPLVVDSVILSERLLGTAGPAVDDSGLLYITFKEFMLFLETEDQVTRVMHAARHHRLEVKRAFFELAAAVAGAAATDANAAVTAAPAIAAAKGTGNHGADSLMTANSTTAPAMPGNGEQTHGPTTNNASCTAGHAKSEAAAAAAAAAAAVAEAEPPTAVAEPAVQLSTLRQAIHTMAMQPGSGWGVSSADLAAVLTADLFRTHQATGCRTGAGITAANGQDAASTTLLVPEEQDTATCNGRGSSATAAGEREESREGDVTLTWPRFFNTVSYLLNSR